VRFCQTQFPANWQKNQKIKTCDDVTWEPLRILKAKKHRQCHSLLTLLLLHPVHIYAREPKQARGLILGFAAFDEQSIRKAVRAWATALRD
jgi:hypothetical protein